MQEEYIWARGEENQISLGRAEFEAHPGKVTQNAVENVHLSYREIWPGDSHLFIGYSKSHVIGSDFPKRQESKKQPLKIMEKRRASSKRKQSLAVNGSVLC